MFGFLQMTGRKHLPLSLQPCPDVAQKIMPALPDKDSWWQLVRITALLNILSNTMHGTVTRPEDFSPETPLGDQLVLQKIYQAYVQIVTSYV